MGETSDHRGRVRVERSPKRIRALLGGHLVADSIEARLVWENPHVPVYYLPGRDVEARLEPTGRVEHSPSRGDGQVFDVVVPGGLAPEGARAYPDSPIEDLRQLVRFEWDALDEWLEEDEPVYVHPRNPYTRVDILNSSRHVRVEIDKVAVADSDQPRILFETGLPPRYYLPLSHLRTELLRPSTTVSHCPYKGTATYWSLEVGGRLYEDHAWTYRAPLPESQKIAGLVSFYNEKVDLFVDGTPLERPRTPFS